LGCWEGTITQNRFTGPEGGGTQQKKQLPRKMTEKRGWVGLVRRKSRKARSPLQRSASLDIEGKLLYKSQPPQKNIAQRSKRGKRVHFPVQDTNIIEKSKKGREV